jgi:hypothetical protein
MITLNVKVRENKAKGWEGTVSVPGLKSTKLSRKDGTTLFPTRGALNAAARGIGKKLGVQVEYDEPGKKVTKKAAKSKTKKCTCPTVACSIFEQAITTPVALPTNLSN